MHHMRRYSVCRAGCFHRKKCPPVTSGSPLPCHLITNFPPLCSLLCGWQVEWKIPEHGEQMPLFLLDYGTCRHTGQLCWVCSWPGVFELMVSLSGGLDISNHIMNQWSVWRLGANNRLELFLKLCIAVRSAHPAIELTWWRRSEVSDWKQRKIKVMTCDCNGNFWH